MTLNKKDEQTLRKYLLGSMSAEEQQDVEMWLMSEDQALDELEAAEDELIDDSLKGRLRGRDLDQFNRHFLIAPERKRKLQFTRSLHRFIDSQSVPEPTSFWALLRAALKFRGPLVYVTAALLAALMIGGIWTTRKQMELLQQLDSTLNQLAEAGRQRDALRKQLNETQTATEDLRKQVRALEETVVQSKSGPAPTLIAVNLIPNLTRAASNVPAVTITSGSQFVRFSLLLLDDNYPSYRVVLRDADGKELWSKDSLSSVVTPDGKAIVVLVPVSLFLPADYTFSLSGISTPQAPENIGTFLFRIVRGRS